MALVGTAAAQAYILRDYPDWSRPITPVLLILAVLAAAVLIAARLGPRLGGQIALRLWTPLVAAVGAIALLIAPVAWSLDTAAAGDGGLTPTAGPSVPRDAGGFGGFGGFARLPGADTPQAAAFDPTLPARRRLPRWQRWAGGERSPARYLEQHQGNTKFLFATTNSNSAAPYIIQTGKAVMSMGGFSGSNPILTLPQLQALVKNNTVREGFLAGAALAGAAAATATCSGCRAPARLSPPAPMAAHPPSPRRQVSGRPSG